MGSDEGQPFFDWGWVADNLTDDILLALWQHVVIVFVAVAVALAISIPIGVLCARNRALYGPALAFTGFLYTIPSLAFFAFVVSAGFGIGRRPVIIALVAYSLLILVRNTVVGLDSVPKETIDAARGMGLTNRQILFRVELPLALPVIVAGIRITTVTLIGIATIGAYIGGGGLGEPIFDGIRRQFATPIIVGAGLTALLAIATDVSLSRVENYLRPWRRAKRAA